MLLRLAEDPTSGHLLMHSAVFVADDGGQLELPPARGGDNLEELCLLSPVGLCLDGTGGSAD
eukprot:4985319-Prorocentrum_lima.AAC.1